MRPLYTIGHTQKPLRRFIELLRGAQVSVVIDVRRHNTSQLAGFAKRDDLGFLLAEGFGIRYAHHPEFAPTEEILSRYKRDRDWQAYEASFRALMAAQGMAARLAAVLAPHERPCLLCAEDSPTHCHRRLLAEAVASVAEWEVRHLR